MSAIGQEPIAEQVRRLLEPVLERDGYELVDVEWLRQAGRWTLRVFVDRAGGVGIDECQAVSRTVEPILDLEVSSPGLDRPLRKPQDFVRHAGQRTHVKAYAPVADTAPGQAPRKHWTGTLRGFQDGL